MQGRATEKKSCKAEVKKKTQSYSMNCTVTQLCLQTVPAWLWHLGNHFKLHTLYLVPYNLAATLYCTVNSSWTLVAKQPCEKTLMDNHVFKAITKKYGLSTVILLDLFAFKQYKRNLGNIGVISQLTCINDNCGYTEL